MIRLVKEFATFASQRKGTPAQLVLAWVSVQGDDIIPIPNTYLKENAAAVDEHNND